MDFKFSFSNKTELIYIGNEMNKAPVGSLLRELIDVDWMTLEDQLIAKLATGTAPAEVIFFEIKTILKEQVSHPAVKVSIGNTENIDMLACTISRLETGSRIITYILESLVDEEQHSYEERLFSITEEQNNLEIKNFFDTLGAAKMLPVNERNNPIYHAGEEFPFLFETTDLMTLAIQELQYLCSNRFFIRKCALCKRFIWTRKMNKVYCDRKLMNAKKTCAQLGPARVWSNNSSEAYSLYWSYRRRLFQRNPNALNEYCYQRWLSKTEPYKELARKNEISIHAMKSVLDQIESEIYTEAFISLKTGNEIVSNNSSLIGNQLAEARKQIHGIRILPNKIFYKRKENARVIKFKQGIRRNVTWCPTETIDINLQPVNSH